MHIPLLTAYLHTIGLHTLSQIECNGRGLREMKDEIDKLPAEASARMRERDVMTVYEDDDTRTRREFSRELRKGAASVT